MGILPFLICSTGAVMTSFLISSKICDVKHEYKYTKLFEEEKTTVDLEHKNDKYNKFNKTANKQEIEEQMVTEDEESSEEEEEEVKEEEEEQNEMNSLIPSRNAINQKAIQIAKHRSDGTLNAAFLEKMDNSARL